MYRQLADWSDAQVYQAILDNEAAIAASKSIDPKQAQFVRCLRAEFEERRGQR